jgi:multidrug efflux pump subunit AcrB
MLSSPDYKHLQKQGAKVEEAMSQTKGVVSVLKTWDMDKVVYNLNINEKEAMNYGVKRSDVTAQIQMMLRGVPVATFQKENSMDYTVRVWLPQKQIDDFSTMLSCSFTLH